MSSPLVGYLALGTLDPVTAAFVEAAFAGYARQPIAFDLDKPTGGGAVGTGGTVLRNINTAVFPAPTAFDWPAVNAYALFTAASGGAAQIIVPLGGRAGVHARGTTRRFVVGSLVLFLANGALSSPLGGVVQAVDRPAIVGGVLQLGSASLGGALSGAAPLVISGIPNAANLYVPFAWKPTVTGGYGPQSFVLTGTLPSNMSLDGTTGTIAGMATVAATTTGLAITVTDDSGSATLSNLTLVSGGFVNLIDADGYRLTDADGAYLMEVL